MNKQVKYFVLGLATLLFLVFQIFEKQGMFVDAFTFLFLTTVPGFFLRNIIIRKSQDIIRTGLYSFGLSIAFLMLFGLLVNLVLPIFGFVRPLTHLPLLISFFPALLVLYLFSSFFDRYEPYRIDLSFADLMNTLPFIVLFILSIFGALSLNNGGTNFLTGAALLLIATIVLHLTFNERKISDARYVTSIIFIGLSVLFMVSLRSGHIAGWDINEEFEVFQITKLAGHWSMENIRHDYNACLSITILPVIFSQLTSSIPDEYIYKVLFQIIFAIVPAVMYVFFRYFTDRKSIAFLASFYFIAQPFFVQPMPALIRQETAFLFFSLFLLVLYDSIKKTNKEIALLLFGFSMVISHYSTTYVTIAFLVTTFTLLVLVEYLPLLFPVYCPRFIEKITLTNPRIERKLTIRVVVILCLLAMWQPLLTRSTNNPYNTLKEILPNITKSFSYDLKSNDVSKTLSIFSNRNIDNVQNDIDAYINPSIDRSDSNQYYPEESFENYKPKPVLVEPVKALLDTRYNGLVLIFFDVVKLTIKLSLLFGSFYFVFRYVYSLSSKSEFSFLVFSAILSIILIMVVPELSIKYNLTRLYMQALILLALPAVLGGVAIFSLISKKFGLMLFTFVLVAYFLYLSGFVSNIFGGQAFIQMNNSGDDYEKFYTHDQEVSAIRWFMRERDPISSVYADEVSSLRLYSFGLFNKVDTYLVPKTILRNSYVHARYQNIKSDRTDVTYLGKHIIFFSFPFDFLNQNKNLIYNNGGSRVYH